MLHIEAIMLGTLIMTAKPRIAEPTTNTQPVKGHGYQFTPDS